MPLTWSVVIPTYNREHILPRALLHAAQSTRPPAQIIVIDASANWEQTREKAMHEIASRFPEIEWIYRKAKVASSAHQRNQGVELSSSDLVFFIDDDLLMYSDCAEEIVKIFEKDVNQKVMGIGTILVAQPPDEEEIGKVATESVGQLPQMQGNVPTRSKLKKWLRHFFERDVEWLLPYDGDWPMHPIPPELAEFPIVRAKTLSGCRMCVRRSIAIKEPFESVLHRYAYLEDCDMSYRASRHGLMLTCLSAKICHLEIFGGRLPPYVVALLGSLESGGAAWDLQRRQSAIQRAAAAANAPAHDVSGAQGSPGRAAHASFSAWSAHSDEESRPGNEQIGIELRKWYPQFQLELIERHRGE